MAKDKNWIIYGVVALVAAYLLLPGFQGWVNGLFHGSGTTEPTNPLTGTCLQHDAITLNLGPVTKKFDQSNSYQPYTTNNNVYDRVFINGLDLGLKQDGTTLTVSYGQEVCIYYAANSSDFYANKACFKVPCAARVDSPAPKDDSGAMATFTAGNADSYKILAFKNLTFNVFNQDDNLKNTQANNQSIGKNDQKTLRINVNFPSAGAMAPAGKWYMNFRVNGSMFDTVTLSGDGVESATTSSYRSKLNASTDLVYYTFSIPGMENQYTTQKDYYVMFDTANTVPADDSSSENISVTYDDDNWYRNTENGQMVLGPADNVRADVGASTNHMATIYLKHNG